MLSISLDDMILVPTPYISKFTIIFIIKHETFACSHQKPQNPLPQYQIQPNLQIASP